MLLFVSVACARSADEPPVGRSPTLEALADSLGAPPLMLLDDVASELDAGRREALLELLRDRGQSVITTTALDDVPGARDAGVARIEVRDARVLGDSEGAATVSGSAASGS